MADTIYGTKAFAKADHKRGIEARDWIFQIGTGKSKGLRIYRGKDICLSCKKSPNSCDGCGAWKRDYGMEGEEKSMEMNDRCCKAEEAPCDKNGCRLFERMNAVAIEAEQKEKRMLAVIAAQGKTINDLRQRILQDEQHRQRIATEQTEEHVRDKRELQAARDKLSLIWDLIKYDDAPTLGKLWDIMSERTRIE